jgi:hypothetical protein
MCEIDSISFILPFDHAERSQKQSATDTRGLNRAIGALANPRQA